MKFKKLKAEIEELEDKLTTNEDLQESIQNEQKEIINEMKKIGIERLPYSYSSLGRFIDPKTMNVHYNKHYKGYVEKLNAALANLKGADAESSEKIRITIRLIKSHAASYSVSCRTISSTRRYICTESHGGSDITDHNTRTRTDGIRFVHRYLNKIS